MQQPRVEGTDVVEAVHTCSSQTFGEEIVKPLGFCSRRCSIAFPDLSGTCVTKENLCASAKRRSIYKLGTVLVSNCLAP